MTAPSATELPTAQPNVPANSRHPGPRAVPSVSSVLILPTGPIVDRHRRPQERLQAARRPPAYPNQARIIAPVTPSHPSAVLTPSTCMNRWIRANAALYRIVVVRLRHDRRTKAYMGRRTAEGMSKAEVIRCLKRYVAREVFSVLQNSAEMIARAA